MLSETISYGLASLIDSDVIPAMPVVVSCFLWERSRSKAGLWLALIYGAAVFVLGAVVSSVFKATGLLYGNDWVFPWMPAVLYMLFTISGFVLVSGKILRAGRALCLAVALVLTMFVQTYSLISRPVPSLGYADCLLLSFFAAIPFTLLAVLSVLLSEKVGKADDIRYCVKVAGLLELALTVKYLSDLGVTRELCLGIWILIFLLILLYLSGIFPYSRRRMIEDWNFVRILFVVLTVYFEIYLVSGLYGVPLYAISEFIPLK